MNKGNPPTGIPLLHEFLFVFNFDLAAVNCASKSGLRNRQHFRAVRDAACNIEAIVIKPANKMYRNVLRVDLQIVVAGRCRRAAYICSIKICIGKVSRRCSRQITMVVVTETDIVPLCRPMPSYFRRIDIGLKNPSGKGYTISCGETICSLRAYNRARRSPRTDCAARNRDVAVCDFTCRTVCSDNMRCRAAAHEHFILIRNTARGLCTVGRPLRGSAVNQDAVVCECRSSRSIGAIGI